MKMEWANLLLHSGLRSLVGNTFETGFLPALGEFAASSMP